MHCQPGSSAHCLACFPDFKRSVEPAVIQAVGALLKAYQEEVDRLTNRCA